MYIYVGHLTLCDGNRLTLYTQLGGMLTPPHPTSHTHHTSPHHTHTIRAHITHTPHEPTSHTHHTSPHHTYTTPTHITHTPHEPKSHTPHEPTSLMLDIHLPQLLVIVVHTHGGQPRTHVSPWEPIQLTDWQNNVPSLKGVVSSLRSSGRNTLQHSGRFNPITGEHDK